MRGGAFIGLAGIVAVILGFIPPAVAAEDHQAAINDATSVAENWLALADGGKYDASWDAASLLLRIAVTKVTWRNNRIKVRLGA